MVLVSFLLLNFWQFELRLFELILDQCDEVLASVVVLDEVDPRREPNVGLLPGREGRLSVELRDVHPNPGWVCVILETFTARLALESAPLPRLLVFRNGSLAFAVDSDKFLDLDAHVRLLARAQLRVMPAREMVALVRHALLAGVLGRHAGPRVWRRPLAHTWQNQVRQLLLGNLLLEWRFFAFLFARLLDLPVEAEHGLELGVRYLGLVAILLGIDLTDLLSVFRAGHAAGVRPRQRLLRPGGVGLESALHAPQLYGGLVQPVERLTGLLVE